MSYILDALKQNEASKGAPMTTQGDYQQEYLLNKKVQFYRNLALGLGFVLTLTLGFFIGKSIQKNHQVAEIESKAPVQPNNSATSEQAVVANNLNGNVQYQFVPVPVYTQPAQMVNQFPVVNQAPTNIQANNNEQINANTQQPVSAEKTESEADLSEYTVVGYQQQERQETNALIDAFSEAFEQAQNQPFEQEVITSSSTSADVVPIDLLPQPFKARLPAIAYQAHVYASEASRSWVKINGRELKVGDNFSGVYIVEIAAEQLLMQYDGVEFSLGAMDDWQF